MSIAAQEQVFTSWGRVRRERHRVVRPRYRDELPSALSARGDDKILAVGMGRSYGESALNPAGTLLDMTLLDRVIAFDPASGILRAEAGMTIDDVLRLVVPHGWFLPTTPGTRFVTLGGAVANDVHGKNHHRAGSIGCHVRGLGLLRSDGAERRLNAEDNDPLFAATIGGLGLTGVITWVELALTRIGATSLNVERTPFHDVAGFFRLAEPSAESHEHTVAWFDCAGAGASLGRGIFQRANWAAAGALEPHNKAIKLQVPLDAPTFVLNGWTIGAFNTLYWHLQKSGRATPVEHYGSFFFPLDAVGNWNRIYGRRGFYQYQCVIPPAAAEGAIAEMIRQISRSRMGSFLAVLKTLGLKPSPGLLSFPRAGTTLALDFANQGQPTLDLLARLDDIVVEAGGRLYPAKDGRIPASVFRAGYGEHLEAFARQVDPAFSSEFWKRVSA